MESVEHTTFLTSRGYELDKEAMDFNDIKETKQELTVSANVPPMSPVKPTPFSIYCETETRLIVPRHYGFEHFGNPDQSLLPQGKSVNIPFKGSLRDYQHTIINTYLNHVKNDENHGRVHGGGGLISVGCGQGKCLGKDTPILMVDGTIKLVQDVKVGDVLMGDDSMPRTVHSLARGREQMYKITPADGDSYIVNENHILSLKSTERLHKTIQQGDIIDISLKDYLKWKSHLNRESPLRGYRASVDFPLQNIELEPYRLGLWIGNPFTYKDNVPKEFIRKYKLDKQSHIPHHFKCNYKTVRLDLLAGLLDSTGYVIYEKCNIVSRKKTLLQDIRYVSRSVGINATILKHKVVLYGKGIKQIPTQKHSFQSQLANYTFSEFDESRHSNDLMVKLSIKQVGIDDYYGFEIDGNRRFLLGDFTVTHNTVMALNIISQLSKKTLVVVHKEFLLNQWIERIKQFLPSARIGKIQGKTLDTENKDIVIGMLQSLSMKEYPSSLFQQFGFTIIDECFLGDTRVISKDGICTIQQLYKLWNNRHGFASRYQSPIDVLSYNRYVDCFEWRPMTFAWKSYRNSMATIHYHFMDEKGVRYHSQFKCTPDHKILVKYGTAHPNDKSIRLRHMRYLSNHNPEDRVASTLYIRASELQKGDQIVGGDMDMSETNSYSFSTYPTKDYIVDNVELDSIPFEPYTVYDIEVDENHNFVIVPECNDIQSHGLVVSNCHHIGAEVFSRALFKMVSPYMLGLSATLTRKDGLTKVFKMFLGDVVYQQKQTTQQNIEKEKRVLIRAIQFETEDEKFNKIELNFKGQMNYAIMIRKLCEYTRRTEFILNIIYDLIQENKHHQIMVLAHNKSVLMYVHDAIEWRGWSTVGYYVGGMKEKALKESEKNKVIIATYAMAEEALDIKTLTTLVMITPKTDVQQAVGRILRSRDPKARPVVVDITDTHNVFKRQWKKREKYYKKNHYEITMTTRKEYMKMRNTLLDDASKQSTIPYYPPFEHHPNLDVRSIWTNHTYTTRSSKPPKKKTTPTPTQKTQSSIHRTLLNVNVDALSNGTTENTETIVCNDYASAKSAKSAKSTKSANFEPDPSDYERAKRGLGKCMLSVSTEELNIPAKAYNVFE